MKISVTELKKHLGKYLQMAETEDIYITRNGKTVAKLTKPYWDRAETAKALAGIIPPYITMEEAKSERRMSI